MRRVFWIAVGAAGGIWAYRRALAMSDQAREQGFVLTAQQVAGSGAHVLGSAKTVAATTLAQARSVRASAPSTSDDRAVSAANAVWPRGEGE